MQTMRERIAKHLIRLAIGVPALGAFVAVIWAMVEYGSAWVMIGLSGMAAAYCFGSALQVLSRKP